MSKEYNAERHVEGLRATIKRLEGENYNLSDKLSKKRKECGELKHLNQSLYASRELYRETVKDKNEEITQLNRFYNFVACLLFISFIANLYFIFK